MDAKNDWREGVETLLELIEPFREMHDLDMLSLSLCSDGSGHLEFEFKIPPLFSDLKPHVDYTIGFNCLNMLNLILLHGDPAELAREDS